MSFFSEYVDFDRSFVKWAVVTVSENRELSQCQLCSHWQPHSLSLWTGSTKLIPNTPPWGGQIDGLVQDCSIPSALTMEIPPPCTKPSKCYWTPSRTCVYVLSSSLLCWIQYCCKWELLGCQLCRQIGHGGHGGHQWWQSCHHGDSRFQCPCVIKVSIIAMLDCNVDRLNTGIV